MALPSPETVKRLLASSRALRERVLAIARRLEAVGEYHPEQALMVATDIVLSAVKKSSAGITGGC